MANDKKFVVKRGLATPNVDFANGGGSIGATFLSTSNTLSFSGNTGQLFSITDSMSGTIFSVNDISGIPSIEVIDTGSVKLAETFGSVSIGANTLTTHKLYVNGNTLFTNATFNIGATLTNKSRLSFKTLNGNTVFMEQQDDDNFVLYTTTPTGTSRPVYAVFANSTTSNLQVLIPFQINNSLVANSSTGAAGQVLTSSGSGVYWSTGIGGANNTSYLNGKQESQLSVNNAVYLDGRTWATPFAIGGTVANTGTFTSITGSANVNIDSGTLFVDALSNRAGVGTLVPSVKFDVVGADGDGLQYRTSTRTIGIGSVGGVNALYGGSGTELTFHIGSEQMRLTSTGRLGIGTQTPQTPFVVSNAGAGGLEFDGSTGLIQSYNRSTSAYQTMLFDASATVFRPSGTERMRVNATGLGIGNTTPGQTLQVDGSVGVKNGIVANGSFGSAGFVLTSNGTVAYWANAAAISGTVLNANNASFLNGRIWETAGAIGATVANTGAFTTLSTTGDIQQQNANYVRGRNSSGTSSRIFGINSANTLYVGGIDVPLGATLFVNNGVEQMRIESSGNVSIGSTATPTKLFVNGHMSVANGFGIYANGVLGSAGFVLTSNGTSLYWANASSISGTVANSAALQGATWQAPLGIGTVTPSSGAFTTITASANVNLDSGTLFVDGPANRVGVGTATPSTRFHVGTKVSDDNVYTYDGNTAMVVHQQPTSTTVLNDPKETLLLARQGTGGQAYGAAASFDLSRYENNGVNSRTRLDIKLAHGSFLSSSIVGMTLLSSGNVGLGGNTTPGQTLQVDGSIGIKNGIVANGSFGTTGFVLTSNGSVAYWANAAAISGTVLNANNSTYAYGKQESQLSVSDTAYLGGVLAANYTRKDLTYLGSTGSVALDSVTDTAAEWSALPVGYARMIGNAIGTAGGAPLSNYGYFFKVANRDTSGGWGGLWAGYTAGQNYIGRSPDSSTLASWDLLWSSANDGAGSGLDADLLDGQQGSYYTNADNIGSGTLAEARLPFRMNQSVRTTDNVTFANLTITGSVLVTGNVTTWSSNNLSISDNMIYLNANSTTANPDLGFAGNYNDGTYRHAGFFRDATDATWKVFDRYTPEPDASPYIDTGHATFRIADFQANTIHLNSLYGNNKEIFNTSDSYLRINQSNGFTNGIWMTSSNLGGGAGTIHMGSNGDPSSARVRIIGGTYNGTNVITLNGTNGNITATNLISAADLSLTGGMTSATATVNSGAVYRSDWTTWFQSSSDFVDGTLVTTNIPANVTNGDSFIIEITGKSYSGTNPPFKVIAQGYIYDNTLLSCSGISYGGTFASYIKVFEDGGVLKFWWPRITYWNSFNVNVISMDAATNGTITRNRVTAIGNATEPTGTKKVQITLATVLNSTSFNPSNYLALSGGTMTGAITFAGGQTWPTFNQNTTGSAATLTTARNINGTSFNGSANITTASWGTARTLTIGNTGKSVDGSAAVSWTHAELGAVRNLGVVAVQAVVGSNQTCTTAQFITWLTGIGAFSQTASVMKCTWDYAGNNDLSDTGFGTLDLAGCVIETFTDGGQIIVRVTSPSTGSGAGGIHEYIDHGPSYSPGWRRVYTSTLNGNISGSSGSTTGNAATATTLQTARLINGVSFNGSADITVADSTKLPLAGGTMTGALVTASGAGVGNGNARSLITGYSGGNYGQTGYGISFTTTSDVHNYAINDAVSLWEANDGLRVRAAAGGTVGTAITWTTVLDARRTLTAMTFKGNTVLDSANYNSYALPLGGGTMTGAITFAAGQTWPTFNQSTTGSAATLTTARTLTIGSTGKTFNGSANVSWTLSEIGAAATSHTHVITDISDAARWWNNFGDNHGTRSSFDATTPTIGFGWRYVQGSTNGPGVNGAGQYYSQYVGLGNDYGSTGAGSYGMQIAYPRNVTTPYITIRFNESNSFGAWQKISAGYADTAGSAATLTTARLINGQSFNGSADITVADSTKLPLAGGTMTGAIAFAGGQTWPTFNQNTTGQSGSVSGLTLNSSANGIDPNSVTQNQIGYSTSVSLFGQSDGGLYSSAYGSSWIHQIFGDFRTGQIAIRGKNNGTWQSWRTVLDSTNYTNYAPTKTGTGASGTWDIAISGNAATATSASSATNATNALRIVFNDGPRDLSDRLPNSFTRTVNFDFVGAGTGNGAGNYAGVMTFAPWTGTTASTGDSSYQLSFGNQSGVNASGPPRLSIRSGIDSTWGSWYIVLTSANYTDYAPTKTGTGASGTWAIAISGNAATATSATSSPLLSALNNYVWSQSSLPNSYSLGITNAFVGPGAGEGSWQSYGSVMTMRTYSGGGGSLQMYVPYGPSNGGTGLQVRFGNYDVSSGNSWTSWKTLLASDNFNSYALPLTGGTLSGTLSGTIGAFSTRLYTGYDSGETGSVSCSNWFRSNGDTGWYQAQWGGGIHMSDSTWVRVYNSKAFYVNNEIAALGNVTAYYSDERLKTKTGKIDNAIAKVKSLNGFTYVENDLARELGYNNNKQQVGVSAQEVQAVLPEAVSLAPVDYETLEDGTIVSKSGEDYLTVDYSRLVPLLIEAIKEQQQTINKLEEKVNRLVDRIYPPSV